MHDAGAACGDYHKQELQVCRYGNLEHNVYKLAEIFVNRIESGSMVIDIWKDAKEVVEDLPAVREFHSNQV